MKLFQAINQSGDPEPVIMGKYSTYRQKKERGAGQTSDKGFRPFLLVLGQICSPEDCPRSPSSPSAWLVELSTHWACHGVRRATRTMAGPPPLSSPGITEPITLVLGCCLEWIWGWKGQHRSVTASVPTGHCWGDSVAHPVAGRHQRCILVRRALHWWCSCSWL